MKQSEIFKRTIIFLFAQLSKADQAKTIDAIKESGKLTKAVQKDYYRQSRQQSLRELD